MAADAGRPALGGGAGGGLAGLDAGAVDAGAVVDAGSAPCGACNIATPVCDVVARRCVRCTATQGCFGDLPTCDLAYQGGLGRCEVCVADGGGCGGATPICDTSAARCVGCVRHEDCPSGQCELGSQVCFLVGDGGFFLDAGVDAGRPDSGVFPDGGPSCPGPRDGGLATCVTECPQGFVCSGSECVLNGKGADLQVTLRWDSTDDLDLYVLEPLADGGTDAGVCEIFYGNRAPACAQGSLDLDSQAGCSMDLVLIENVIYPQDGGFPTPGTYEVRVNHFRSCSALSWVPFEVTVRKSGTTTGLCGVFQRGSPDFDIGGGAGAGRPIFTFTYP